MISLMKALALAVSALSLVSCAGYHLGGVKPASLANVRSIAVPMFSNATLHPRAEALATSAVANALVQDGTYRLARVGDADAVLEGKLRKIDYSPLRGSRFDTLLPEELVNKVELVWVLRDARDPTQVLASGVSVGRSQLFVSANLQTARNNALPEALDHAGEALVSRIADGF
jgi:hypothetical protein